MLSVSILTSFVLASFEGGSREPGDKLAAFSLLGIDFDGAALDLTRIRSNVKRAAPVRLWITLFTGRTWSRSNAATWIAVSQQAPVPVLG
ncbi:hypothetical protein GGQ07_002796 [Salinibacter ruber]|nr:hypothetical protein [Salinibacter ruber]MCS4181340.1 hypothetical protein [Salinibacter ruber]